MSTFVKEGVRTPETLGDQDVVHVTRTFRTYPHLLSFGDGLTFPARELLPDGSNPVPGQRKRTQPGPGCLELIQLTFRGVR